LEKIISNDYAERFGQVWVICGPVFSKEPPTLHNGMVVIPDRFFKIVLRVDADQTPRVLAFEMPQIISMDHRQQDLVQYLVPLSEAERDSGIEFFPQLDGARRTELETTKATKLW
jgi:endonuclease G